MSNAFMYFLPQLQAAIEDDIKRAGILDNANDVPEFQTRAITNAIDGLPGVIVSFLPATRNGKAFVPGYYPDKQEWKKSLNGKYWLGLYKDQKPGPDDLVKKQTINGHNVKLQDGNDWLVPVARLFPEGSILPHSLVLGENGQLVQEITPEFVRFSKTGERIWQEFKAQLGWEDIPEDYQRLDKVEEWNIVVEALAVNYNIGAQEISILRLLTTQNIVEIFQAIIDVPTMKAVIKAQEESVKKKDHADIKDGQTSTCGVGTF